MTTLQIIKDGLKLLYETAPAVHISVNMTRPRLVIEDSPAVITGVYPNIFRIEERSSGYPRSHSLQYTDVLIGHIRISELNIE